MTLLPSLVFLFFSPAAPWGGGHVQPPFPPPPPLPPPDIQPGNAGTAVGRSSAGSGAPSGATTGSPSKGSAPRPAATGPRPGANSPSTGRPYKAPAGTAAATATIAAAVDLTTWEYWWMYNKDGYLNVKQHIEAFVPRSGENAALDAANAWDVAGERVLPEVMKQLASEADFDPILAGLVASARLCDGSVRSSAGEVAAACESMRKNPNQMVSEASIMAQGIVADQASVTGLCALLRDTPDARRTLGGKNVPERMRAFAGLSLGLLGAQTENEDLRRFIVHHLAQQLADAAAAQPDTQTACAIAIGLVPLADVPIGEVANADAAPIATSASLNGEVRFLLSLLENTDVPIYVRAHLPKSVAALAAGTRMEPRVTRALIDRLAVKNEKLEVTLGCVLALGGLADSSAGKLDTEVREVLTRHMSTGDAQTRCFATIGLAQVATRGEDGPAVEATRAALLESLVAGRSTRERTWSALALGVLEHGRRQSSTLAQATEFGLARGLREARSPEEIGAFAIACGLAGAQAAAPVLLDHLRDVKETRAVGYVALALGMLECRDALEPLHKLLDEARLCSEKLPQTALALTLLEDPSLVTRLVGLLDKSSSQSTKQAAAAALGAAGDRRAVDPLLALMKDDNSIASTRGAALAAIGRVCDRDPLPWQSAVSRGLNYRAMTVTLSSEDHGGLLDLR